jgi:ElaB/YqjD/DUF883 family membrane-anchored ribosome-binding protein
MDAVRDPSLEELRQESERTRAQLTETVGHLRAKVGETAAEIKTMVSPAHIKQEIRTYVREERGHLTDTVQRAIRDNPLQAAAIGAAVAYPVWGLLRSIPPPLLMIGAGLFLTTSRGKATVDAAKAKVDAAYRESSEKVAGALGDAKDLISGQSGTATDALSATRANLTEAVRSTVNDITEGAGALRSQVEGKVAGVGVAADSTVSEATGKAKAFGAQTRTAVADFIEQNPVLVASIGAAVGAAIAASVPASEAENRLFAGPRDFVKSKAADLTASGVEKAKQAVASATEEVVNAASSQGLGLEGFKRSVDGVVDGAKSVADRGLESALQGVAPGNKANNQQPQASYSDRSIP